MKKAFGKRLVSFLLLLALFVQPSFSEDLLVTTEQLNILETTLNEQALLIEKQEAQLQTLNTQLQKSNEEILSAKTSLQTFEKETVKTKVTLSILFFTVGLLAGITAPVVFPGAFD